MSLDNTNDRLAKTPIALVGCGILKKEILLLIKKNNWPLVPRLFDSSLHVNFNKLGEVLEKGLAASNDLPTVVFFGTCHPLMDKILLKWNTSRTPGQNCVEILLGKDLFASELEQGAFFLLEDWARRFAYVTGMAFNDNPDVTRQIFQMEHKYLLGVRTPCSKDFTMYAEKASGLVGLPLRWMDVDLDRLEQTLELTIEKQRKLP